MKVFLTKRSYFTFRGVRSGEIDVLGKSVFMRMKQLLQAEDATSFAGEGVVLDPVYPFLTREKLLSYLEEREGSYRFEGGFLVRPGEKISSVPRTGTGCMGPKLFSLADLPSVLAYAARENAARHIAAGALVEEGAIVGSDVILGKGAIVRSGSLLCGKCVIGEGAEITCSCLKDSEVGAGSTVLSSTLVGAKVGAFCTVGPYAFLRAGSVVEDNCRIGDFVEIKNAHIGKGTKAAHLAYVGDADVGKQVNIGCGAVFVNYDGKKKNRTRVGDFCFIGSNCNLIAPLELGDGAFVAAGSTLTKSLAGEDFCIARAREVIKPMRGKRYYDPSGQQP